MSDEPLLDDDLESLITAVVEAIEPGAAVTVDGVHRVVAENDPEVAPETIAQVLRLLREPRLEFKPGEPPTAVLARIRVLTGELLDEPAPEVDDRY
ncbi:hypothetical protein [Nocardia sp. NPDC050793]|uniref:hypothetical protein n=1 Tax=Nocardia sp. NPDC050793 TaxID=3155159 RepID=UPI00340482F9